MLQLFAFEAASNFAVFLKYENPPQRQKNVFFLLYSLLGTISKDYIYL